MTLINRKISNLYENMTMFSWVMERKEFRAGIAKSQSWVEYSRNVLKYE